jgi:hypothetical protein
LDKLSGFTIDTAQLAIPKEADGSNLLATATLPNKSVFTFALVCNSQYQFPLNIGST